MKDITKSLLLQLQEVLSQVKEDDYKKELEYLSGATLGKHVRHILDFYLCMIRAKNDEILCYDKRNRDLDIETEKQAAIRLIDAICLDLDHLDLNKTITLNQKFGEEEFNVKSSILRELSYNIEHTIHHMAILKIALRQSFTYVEFDEHFGVAFSTVSYKKNLS